MLLTLRLHNFRCFPSLHWEIPAQGAILLGNNAQGKTSLLEALCFALTLQSPRCSRMDKLASHGMNNFGIALDSSTDERRIRWKPRDLQLQNHGVIYRDASAYLQESKPITWLGNQDMKLIQGAAEERRNYLDFLGAQWHPAYRESLQAYRKSLQARNALLKNPRHDRGSLHSFACVLAQHGEVLMKLRRTLLTRLQQYTAGSYRNIAEAPESISLQYEPSTHKTLLEAYEASLSQDERMGFTHYGPHRDNFSLNLNDKKASDFASEGQQRSLAIALMLAQANLLSDETGRAPILLIDDIFGELDLQRREALLHSLPAESQIFITTTQAEWLGKREAPLPLFEVAQGSVRSI